MDAAERILEAARNLLVRGGWEAVTVSAICEEADVYASAVQYHFGSKEELIAQVLDRVFREASHPGLDDILSMPTGRLRLRRAIETLSCPGSMDIQLAYYEVLGREVLSDAGRERVSRQYEDWFEIITHGVGGRPEDAEKLRPYARLLAAVFDGVIVQRLVDPENEECLGVLGLVEELLAPALEGLLAGSDDEETPTRS